MAAINPSIFREYDIRGIPGKDFDASFAYRLGQAYFRFAQKKLGKQKLTISVGRDCRLTGEGLSTALQAGLLAAGAEVIDLGSVSTPVTYFSIYHLHTDGAIMVTGSHNPAEYNGFKICAGKSTLFGEDIQELKRLLADTAKPPAAMDARNAKKQNIVPGYQSYVEENIKLKRKLKIVVDAGNGAAGPIAPALYRRLGCEVIEMFCELDGNFPNHPADPTVVENLQPLIARVKKEKADLGIAFDGDGDRVGVVDENGKILWGDELMVVFSREILRASPGATIISEVKSSNRLYNDIQKKGGKGIMWKTGHSLIKAKMKETHALLAGEMSGHMFFADRFFGFDDAVYAGARFLEIAAATSAPVSTLVSDLPPAVNTPEIRVDCVEEKKWGIVEQIKASLQSKYKTIDIDGVRVEFPDGWGLVRASNTQPVIVMRFEAESMARLNEIRALVEGEARQAGLDV